MVVSHLPKVRAGCLLLAAFGFSLFIDGSGQKLAASGSMLGWILEFAK